MWTKITGFIFAYLLFSLIGFAITGDEAFASTNLTTGIDQDDTTISVTSTANFLSADNIFIGEEKISYTSVTATSFTGVSRGVDKTDAAAHTAGNRVFNQSSNVLNTLAGYNIIVRISDLEGIAVLAAPFLGIAWFFTALIDILAFNYPFFEGDLWGTGIPYLFRMVLIASGAGLAWFLAMVLFRGGAL